tara:strand:+ start:52 stop:999 length:948 start_codon:yes stop_codon:yes gene_type:complete
METILVTGGTGLVGSAIKKVSTNLKNFKFIFMSSKDCNLENYDETFNFFKKISPDYVIHLAANVGGLFKNMNHKVEMFESNMMINMNVLKCSYKFNIKKCISCLSTCIFPDKTSYPIDESMLHNGPPHNSNDAYAYAKRMIEVLSKSYNQQFNTNFSCIIPTNIYGPHDNYHLEDAHVVPALIHKAHIAKQNNEPLKVRGSGKPLRQFIYSEDLAELILWYLIEVESQDTIILSVRKDDEVSIKDIANIIAKESNISLEFQTEYSDGQYKKTADNSKLLELYKKSKGKNFNFTPIDVGLKKSINWFKENFNNCRK